MSAKRGVLASLLAAMFVALAACAGLPTSGPVQTGLPAVESDPQDFQFIPDSPQKDATPAEIVDGFIRAGSGLANNWEIARRYLTDSQAATWNPLAGVTVDVLARRSYEQSGDDEVAVTVQQLATVDEAGDYARADGGETTLKFGLTQQDGQWRISSAPDGLVLDGNVFQSVFHPYSLMYFDPTWTYLVADRRWFPTTKAVSLIATTVGNGSVSPWLAGSVVSAFSETERVGPSVGQINGVAEVDLTGDVLSLSQSTIDRMHAQLVGSLSSAPQIASVELRYNGAPLDVTSSQLGSTTVDQRALVVTADDFGYISGSQVDPMPRVSAAVVGTSPRSVEWDDDQNLAAVQDRNGQALLITRAGATVVDARPRLVAPSLDRFGFVWSVPQDAPDALVAATARGSSPVTGGLAGASRVQSIQVSRDGTRLAGISTVGGVATVWVAGIVRDANGTPTRLTEKVRELATLTGPAIDLAWLGDSTVGVLTTDGDEAKVLFQQIGGPGTVSDAPAGATSISGANPTSARILDSEGRLFNQRGSNWQQVAADVRVLATEQ